MVDLIACVRDRDEAGAALAAGFDGIIGPAPDAAALRPSALIGRLDPANGDAATLVLERDDGGLSYQVIRGRCPSVDELDQLAGIRAGVFVTAADRVVDTVSLPALAALIGHARARGLGIGIGGGLELPDGPRLLALGPAFLVFGRSLRTDEQLDADRCAAITALTVPVDAGSPPTTAHPRDRIFVKDLVLPVAIGIYRSEYGGTQRVRFSVEAAIDPVDRAVVGLGDIVSYDLIVDAIARLTTNGHIEFVEVLAESIADALLMVTRIAVVRVRVEKLDRGPGAVGVEIERARIVPR